MSAIHHAGLEPVVKHLTVPGDPAAVFDLFTARMGEWWPLISHSVTEEDAVGVRFEPGVGGGIFELVRDGSEHEWGRVTAWQPGARVGFTWYPGVPSGEATHVEVTFDAIPEGTAVTLRHSGWEARGEKAAAVRHGYGPGWDYVLARIPGAVPAIEP